MQVLHFAMTQLRPVIQCESNYLFAATVHSSMRSSGLATRAPEQLFHSEWSKIDDALDLRIMSMLHSELAALC